MWRKKKRKEKLSDSQTWNLSNFHWFPFNSLQMWVKKKNAKKNTMEDVFSFILLVHLPLTIVNRIRWEYSLNAFTLSHFTECLQANFTFALKKTEKKSWKS